MRQQDQQVNVHSMCGPNNGRCAHAVCSCVGVQTNSEEATVPGVWCAAQHCWKPQQPAAATAACRTTRTAHAKAARQTDAHTSGRRANRGTHTRTGRCTPPKKNHTHLHIVDLVKDDPGHLPQQLAAPVDHAAQDLCRHDDAVGVGVDDHVTRHQADVAKLLAELPALLAETTRQQKRFLIAGHGRRSQGPEQNTGRVVVGCASLCDQRCHAQAGDSRCLTLGLANRLCSHKTAQQVKQAAA